MGAKQKHNILSNELIRRMSNINKDGTDNKEKCRVVEEFTTEMKNSGWDREATREIVVSGLLGWTRKHDRREKDQLDFYRSAASTLSSRTRRKLTEKANWYKKSGSNDDDNNVTGDKNEHENTQKKRKRYDRTERPAKHEEKVTKVMISKESSMFPAHLEEY